jgi:polar amino acid transport system substrate-binding protein
VGYCFPGYDPAREDKLCFTPPYVTIESSLLVRNDSDIPPYKRWIARA